MFNIYVFSAFLKILLQRKPLIFLNQGCMECPNRANAWLSNSTG